MKINFTLVYAVLILLLSVSISNGMEDNSGRQRADTASTKTSAAAMWRAEIDNRLAAYEREVLGKSFKDFEDCLITVPCPCAEFDVLPPLVKTPITAQLKRWGYAVPQLCMNNYSTQSIQLATLINPFMLRTRVIVNKSYCAWPVLEQSAAVAHEIEHQKNNHALKAAIMVTLSGNHNDIMHRYKVAQEEQADIYACTAMGSQGCEALRLSLLYALKDELELDGIVKNNNKTHYSKFGHSLARIVGALNKNAHKSLSYVEQLVERHPNYKEEQLTHPPMYERNRYLKNLTAALKKQELEQIACDDQ